LMVVVEIYHLITITLHRQSNKLLQNYMFMEKYYKHQRNWLLRLDPLEKSTGKI
jgi:hypothetical protein